TAGRRDGRRRRRQQRRHPRVYSSIGAHRPQPEGEPMTPLSPPDARTVERIVDELSNSRSLLFVTGAGMSADSGLPTYRGVGGLYDRGETEEGLAIEEMLSGPTFQKKPEWTWKYLREVANACRGATFNRGHAVLAEMER